MEILPLLQNVNSLTKSTSIGPKPGSLSFRNFLSGEGINQQTTAVSHMSIPEIEKVSLKGIIKDLNNIIEQLPVEMDVSKSSSIEEYSSGSLEELNVLSINNDFTEMSPTFFLIKNDLKDVLTENPSINELVTHMNNQPSIVNLLSFVKAVEGVKGSQQSDFQPVLSDINTFFEQEFPSFKNNEIVNLENMLSSMAKMKSNDQEQLEGQVLLDSLISQESELDIVLDKLTSISNKLSSHKLESIHSNIQVKQEILVELGSISSSSSDTLLLIDNLFKKSDIQTIESILDHTVNRFLQNNDKKENQLINTFEEHAIYMRVGTNFDKENSLRILPFEVNTIDRPKHNEIYVEVQVNTTLQKDQVKQHPILEQSIYHIETGLRQLSNAEIDFTTIKESLTNILNEATKSESDEVKAPSTNKIVLSDESHPLLNTLLLLQQESEKFGFKAQETVVISNLLENDEEISQQTQPNLTNSLKGESIKTLDVSTLDSIVKGIKSIVDGIQLLTSKNQVFTPFLSNMEEAVQSELSKFKQFQNVDNLAIHLRSLMIKNQLDNVAKLNKEPTLKSNSTDFIISEHGSKNINILPQVQMTDAAINPQDEKFISEIKEETFVLRLNHISVTENELQGSQSTKQDTSIRQEFTNQLLNAFKNSKFAQVPNGANRLILKLNPEHLGLITVKLVQKNGEMVAHLITSSNSAKDLLEHSIHQLKQVLPSVQIEIERYDIQTEQSQKTLRDHSENRKESSSEQQQQHEEENKSEQSFVDSLKEALNTTV
ncbi:flagellar hook-length control protein FliK [Metabacillus schmidteae]|uniref:flagellar hook-length control protein FliK n=1 Tax=Metabacillus schmidteae TaxID=2730405 RepID=UPI001589E2FB|nr:flagellar hook-length control protein FliK [Metabacillus schmidteae]